MYARDLSNRQPALDPDAAEAQVGMAHESGEIRAKMRTVVPWVVSLGGHLGVLVLAGLVVAVVHEGIPPSPVVIPEPPIGEADFVGLPNKAPGPMADVLGPVGEGPPPATDEQAPPIPVPTVPPQGPGRTAQPTVVAQFARGPAMTALEDGRGTGTRGKGIFNVGDPNNTTGGENGSMRTANRIVFLVDASGSLVDTLPFVVEDLSRQLGGKLDAKRQFNVIFFSGAGVNREAGAVKGLASLFPSRLEPATAANQSRAIAWIHQIEAGGSGDPLAAFKQALDMDPDQIHLLSDNITGSGIWEMHQNKFMEEAMQAYRKAVARRQAGGGGRIDIKTYQFVYPDPVEKIGMEPTLQRLARDTGGQPADYAFVTARSLGLR